MISSNHGITWRVQSEIWYMYKHGFIKCRVNERRAGKYANERKFSGVCARDGADTGDFERFAYGCAAQFRLLKDRLEHALHGRFDMDCPPAQVMRLKAALPCLHLTIVSGNHSVLENPMADAFSALVRDVCHNDG